MVLNNQGIFAQGSYEPSSSGIHEIFAVVNQGVPTEAIRQAATVAPGTALMVPYDHLAGTGLLEIAWDPNVPPPLCQLRRLQLVCPMVERAIRLTVAPWSQRHP